MFYAEPVNQHVGEHADATATHVDTANIVDSAHMRTHTPATTPRTRPVDARAGKKQACLAIIYLTNPYLGDIVAAG